MNNTLLPGAGIRRKTQFQFIILFYYFCLTGFVLFLDLEILWDKQRCIPGERQPYR
jgi:hypothetical protein